MKNLTRPSPESEQISLEDHDALVGAIYECVIDPTGWPAALARICAYVGGKAGWIAVHYPQEVKSAYQIESGTDPEWQNRLRLHYVAASPFIGAVHYVRPADILSVDDVVDYDEFVTGRFYREWAGPQGWDDFILGVLTREAERFTWLGVCMGERVRAQHKERVAALLPHVERAVRISDLIELRDTQIANLSAAAEAMSTGMILVDHRLGVRAINSAANRLLQGRSDLTYAAGRLTLRIKEMSVQLQEAVAASANGTLDPAGMTLLIPAEGAHSDLLVQLLPLPTSRLSHSESAVATLFLSEPGRAGTLSPESFAARFGLTPSEVRIALGLLDGRSPRAIAEIQGVSLATVRTHLRRLYDKTGASGQAALVKLIAAATRRA